MKFTINITDTAKGHLRDVATYIAEQSRNKEMAKKFIEELVAVCFKLEEMPGKGANPIDRVLLAMGYKFLVYKEYLIFYTTDMTERRVYIQAIFNGKRDYPRFLRNMLCDPDGKK